MGRFDGYFSGDKKKMSKKDLEKRSKKLQSENPTAFKLPEIIRRPKDNY